MSPSTSIEYANPIYGEEEIAAAEPDDAQANDEPADDASEETQDEPSDESGEGAEETEAKEEESS